MEDVLGFCLERGMRVVANAGGLNPAGLANELSTLAERLGLSAKIAYVDGDDLTPRLEALQRAGLPGVDQAVVERSLPAGGLA
jgi:hypothetical protein